MEKIIVKAQVRAENERADHLRNEGFIPAECYGGGEKNISIKMEYQEFRRSYIQAGESAVIELNIDGKAQNVLVKDINFHPTTEKIIHVDFKFVNMKEEVTTTIPFVITGESPAVKSLGGTVVTNKENVAIKCLPSDLVHEITIDITGLEELGSSIKLSEIKMPKGITVTEDLEQNVVSIAGKQVEKEVAEEETTEEGEEGAETTEETKSE